MGLGNRSITGKEAPQVPYSNPGSFRAQVGFLRRQFLQDGDLPFSNALTEEVIARALTALSGWLDRVFTPLVTLGVFLGQVLSADHSCRAAVARLLAHRLSRGPNGPAPPRPAPTARRGDASPKRSSPTSPARSDVTWMPGPSRPGCGR